MNLNAIVDACFSFHVQDDQLSVKPGDVKKFDQKSAKCLVEILSGQTLFTANFMFGALPVFHCLVDCCRPCVAI